MYQWAQDLWPFNRSLTGQGVLDTFVYLQHFLPGLKVHSIKTGEQVFDWVIPQQWHCDSAYIITPNGKKICDFSLCNLHLVGYSEPVNRTMSLKELRPHLHSLPNQPGLIPYVTSYYRRYWGFCLSHNQLEQLPEGDYQVVINSQLFDGVLNYADCLIKGESEKEILLSTNVCHPSLANNELSGPVMVTALGQWLKQQAKHHFSYRLVYLPETIGAVAYLSQHIDWLIDKVVGGYQVICCGDERAYSYNASPYGDNISDQIALKTLKSRGQFDHYSFLSRGSDERQYCAPHIRLPIASICRSKYGIYPEYHTNGDDLVHVVTSTGLQQTFDLYRDCLTEFEQLKPQKVSSLRPVTPGKPQIKVFCEPQLGKRGLYDTLNNPSHPLYGTQSRTIINVITYCDGSNDAAEIASLIGTEVSEVEKILQQLAKQDLLA
jgi:aminopeptidase-like protein